MARQAAAGHTAVTSRSTRLGTAALGFGGVVFGLIQVLERTVNAFEPRPVVTLMVAVSIGLTGLTLERLRHRAHEVRILRALLRVWPLRRLADTEPLALGIYPPDTPPLGPYVARPEDAAVDEALRKGGLIVLVGPERTGKSRTVHEAAMRTMGERPVVVPLGGPALSALLADDDFTPPSNSIWWLDDLARFLNNLNGPELGALLDGRMVIATVREDTWRELLNGCGESGERGRRLVAAAQVIHLPGEHPAVAQAGTALATAPQPASRPADEVVFDREHDPALFAGGVAATAATIVLAVVIASGGFSKPKPKLPAPPPTIGDQVDNIRREAAKQGRPTVLALTANLHGVDQRSHIFVMRPEDDGGPRPKGKSGSDELRIYDEVDGWLDLKLIFQPQTLQRVGRQPVVTVKDQQEKGLLDYALGEPLILDIDGDGDREVVLSYFFVSPLVRMRLPVVVMRDEKDKDYDLFPLLAAAPEGPDEKDGFVIDYFDGSYKLRHEGGRQIRVGGVSSFFVRPGTGRDDALLVTGTEAVDTRGRSGLLGIHLFKLGLSTGRPLAFRLCAASGFGPTLVRAPRALGADYRKTLERHAPRLARTVYGRPRPGQSGCLRLT